MFVVWNGTVAPGEAAKLEPQRYLIFLIPVSHYPSSPDNRPAASSLKVALSSLSKWPTPQIVHLPHLPWLFSHSFPASLLNRSTQHCTVPFINGICFTLLLKKKKVRGFPWSTEWRSCMRGPLGPSSLYKLTSYNFPAHCSHPQHAEELPPPLPGCHCPLSGGKVPLILQDSSIYSHREI